MTTFSSLGLQSGILEAIAELGFETPTPIQAEAIPIILESEGDLIALAQTGTGKTAAFGLPMLQKIQPEQVRPQALILSPTRELAIQITKDLETFGKKLPAIRSVAVYGGASIVPQMQALRRGVHIVVATPGRAVDLIHRGALDLANIRFVVLDEADEMLNMGFQQDLSTILSETPSARQTLLFSATMAPEIQRIASDYMHQPREIAVGARNSGSVNVTHEFYQVQARDRYEALKRIVAMVPNFYGIIFCRTRRETNDIARKLSVDGFPADAINGDLSQAQRDEVMDAFRDKRITMMVATDVAARGIDVNNLTHVVNYELPDELESYIHRSGRTGRAGNTGISISIIHKREFHKIKSLEKVTRQRFVKKLVPSGQELCESRMLSLIDDIVKGQPDNALLAPYMSRIHDKLDNLSKDELIGKLLSLEFHKMLSEYKSAPDLNEEAVVKREDRPGRQHVSFIPYQINVGSQHQLNPARLMGLINQELPMRLRFGRIDIHPRKAFFELEQYNGLDLPRIMAGADFDGVPLTINKADAMEAPVYDRKKPRSRDAGSRDYGSRDNGGKEPFYARKFGEGTPKASASTQGKKRYPKRKTAER